MARSQSTQTTTQDPEQQVPDDSGESRMTQEDQQMFREIMAERRQRASEARQEVSEAGEAAEEETSLTDPPLEQDLEEGEEPEYEGSEQEQEVEPPPEPAGEHEPQQQGDQEQVDQGEEQEPQGEGQAEAESFEALLAEQPEPIRDMVGRLQQQNEQLWQQYNAVYGRLAPMQRQNSDLQKQLEDLKKASTQSPTLEDLENNSAFKQMADEFPDESGQVKEVFTSQARANQELQQRSEQLQQQLEQERKNWTNVEYRRLLRKHPDFDSIRQSPQFQQWRQQVLENPQAHGDLPQKMTSPLHEDAADVATAFKTKVLGQKPPPPSPQSRQPATQQQPQQQNPQAQISRRRPPPPAPPSQPSRVSGNRPPERPLTGKALYKQIMAEKKRKAKQRR